MRPRPADPQEVPEAGLNPRGSTRFLNVRNHFHDAQGALYDALSAYVDLELDDMAMVDPEDVQALVEARHALERLLQTFPLHREDKETSISDASPEGGMSPLHTILC